MLLAEVARRRLGRPLLVRRHESGGARNEPLEVGDVQVRAVARISLRPLVEELPCLGGAEVSLLGLPHYDLSLRLVNRLDIMRVPGVKAAVDAVVAKVRLFFFDFF